jgi:hypothetical protein
MSIESTTDEQRASVAVQRLVRALRDLFRNPMPHDLITIRREVEREYGGDEEVAKEEMDAWCSQEYMEQQIAAHREAWHNAAEVLREYGPNTDYPEPLSR